MRRLLIAAAMAGTALTDIPHAEAKPIWLECGNQVINLDSAKERFSLTDGNVVYQGRAVYNPGQINFEYQWADMKQFGGLKYAYLVDRKSLKYTKTTLASYFGGAWEPQESTAKNINPKIGQCLIMKTPPTAGNQI